MSLFTWVTVLAYVPLGFGLLLVVLGWRGRRIGDAPFCRACRFDLRGTVPERSTCPECGADLDKPRAIRRGERRCRRRWIITGLILVPLGGTLVSINPGKALYNTNWAQYVPLWGLLHEMTHNLWHPGEDATEELLSRIDGNRLSPGQVATVLRRAKHLTAVQADDYVRWRFNQAVEELWVSDEITNDDFLDYVQPLCSSNVRSRPRVRAGAFVPLECDLATPDWMSHMTYGVRLAAVHLDGVPLSKDELDRIEWMPDEWSAFGLETHLVLLPLPEDTPPGRLTLTMLFQFQAELFDTNKMVTWENSASCQLQVLPADEFPFERTRDPEIDEQVRLALEPAEIVVTTMPDPSAPLGVLGQILRPGVVCAYVIFAHNEPLPIDTYAGFAVIREGQDVISMGTRGKAGELSGGIPVPWTALMSDMDLPDGERVTVRVIPLLQLAEWDMETERVWAGELEYRNVPVRWNPP